MTIWFIIRCLLNGNDGSAYQNVKAKDCLENDELKDER